MDIREVIKLFDLKDVHDAGPRFDIKKLDWLNGVYIRQKDNEEILQLIKPFAPKAMEDNLINQTIPLIKTRLRKSSDYQNLVDFLIKEPKVDPKLLVKKGKNKKETKNALSTISIQLSAINSKAWKAGKIEKIIRQFANSLVNWPASQLFMSIRIALTGKAVTPPLFETMEVLGKEKTIKRLKAALKKLN